MRSFFSIRTLGVRSARMDRALDMRARTINESSGPSATSHHVHAAIAFREGAYPFSLFKPP